VWHRDGVIAEERLRTRQLLLICAVEVLAMALDTGPRLRLLPHLHGCDGFFAAVLERNP